MAEKLTSPVRSNVESRQMGGLAASAVLDMRDIAPERDDGLSWQDRALCAKADPEAFFPEKGGSTREAKKICIGCDVRGDCLKYAIENHERFGVWGGLTERERRKLKKRSV